MTKPTVRKLDREMQTFLAGLRWPPGVPVPQVDAILGSPDSDVPHLRFVGAELAPVDAPSVSRPPGANHFEIITAIATLAECWTRMHDGDPGVYPDGIRGQIMNTLDMRTAAAWLLSFDLAVVLVSQVSEPTPTEPIEPEDDPG